MNTAQLGTFWRSSWSNFARHWAMWREAWTTESARARRDLRDGERDFLPAAIEIMEYPASPLGRTLMWSLCAFFAIAIAWSIVGRIDIVAVAGGKVVPQGRTKSIQPLEIGVVRSIWVQDGDRVTAGQRLIDLDPTDAAADRDRLEHERVARALDVARLDSLLAGGAQASSLKVPEAADPILVEATRRLLDSQWREDRAKIAQLDSEIEQKISDLRVAETDVTRFQSTLPLLQDRSESLKGLATRGLTSRLHASEVEQQYIEAKNGLVAAENKVVQAEAALREARQKRQAGEHEGESAWRKDRADAVDKLSNAEQEIVKAAKRRQLQSLTSPIDGTVTNLAAWTVGGVVKPGDTIMNIVPLSATPEIEAHVLNKDIGFIAAGQAVTVKFDAFPFTRYGTMNGEVIDVSRDANKDDKLGLVYPVRVRLAATTISADGRQVQIEPGMAVGAEIITGQRRVIEYVLSPLLRYGHEAARER